MVQVSRSGSGEGDVGLCWVDLPNNKNARPVFVDDDTPKA